MKWRKATWWPKYLKSIGESIPPSNRKVYEEFWSPSDKKWPLWSVCLYRDMNGTGYFVSFDVKTAEDSWWSKGDFSKGAPTFMLKRLGMMIANHLKKKEKA